jgi:hypothetical protein
MKNSILYPILLFFLLISFRVSSQEWLWANHISCYHHVGESRGVSDRFGNFYITGEFTGDTCHFVTHTLYKKGSNSIFLARYDINGNELWVQQFDVADEFPNNYRHDISGIIVDDLGFIYITGMFFAQAQFGSFLLTSNAGDIFIAKFDPQGNCLWAKNAGGSGEDNGTGLAVDSARNVYVCGNTGLTAIFDTISIPPGGFLAKYDSGGNCLWAKNIIPIGQFGESEVGFRCMLIYKDNLFTGGMKAASSFTIDTISRSHPGKYGTVFCCFDLDGNIKWLKEGVSINGGCGYSLATDIYGNVFVPGNFTDTIDFSGTKLIGDPNHPSFFICKYAKNGNLLWAKQWQSTSTAHGYGVSSDNFGNCYVTGQFSGQASIGYDTITSETEQDMFLARYNPVGECLGVVHFGNAEGYAVGQDQDGNPFVVGDFSGEITIGQNTFTAVGWWDTFVAKCGKITGVGEKKSSNTNQLLIYANPNEGMCSITLPDEFRHEQHLILSIYNNQGKLIQKTSVEIIGDRVSLNIAAQAKGIYTAMLTNGKKNYTGKVVFR